MFQFLVIFILGSLFGLEYIIYGGYVNQPYKIK